MERVWKSIVGRRLSVPLVLFDCGWRLCSYLVLDVIAKYQSLVCSTTMYFNLTFHAVDKMWTYLIGHGFVIANITQ
jgi:hypothetical protein